MNHQPSSGPLDSCMYSLISPSLDFFIDRLTQLAFSDIKCPGGYFFCRALHSFVSVFSCPRGLFSTELAPLQMQASGGVILFLFGANVLFSLEVPSFKRSVPQKPHEEAVGALLLDRISSFLLTLTVVV